MTWLKIAAAVVVLLVVVIVGANLLGGGRSDRQQPPGNKTIDQVWQEDQQRLNAPIPAVQPDEQPSQEQPKLIFRPMTEEQKARAEQLWQMVLTSRKMGRLPGLTYGQMVQYCRQIMAEFPGTEYAYRAKCALADIPDSTRRQYNITDQELSVLEFHAPSGP